MIVVGLILAGIAALIHVYIFVLESLVWTGPRARATFGLTPADAETTRPLAFNQGFYNLFLAIAGALGIVFFAVGQPVVAATLVFVGAGSMAAAAVVLFASSPGKRRAALVQGLAPVLAVITLAIGLAL